MKLSILGYSSNWIKFKLLNETLFNEQIVEFEKDKKQGTEQFRYYTFINWLTSKENVSDTEIDNYLILTLEDEDQQMAGSAVRALFTSPIVTDEQFEMLKIQMAEFGEWTKKVILLEDLKRKLQNEELSEELYKECLFYKKQFEDSRLLITIINKTDNEAILIDFKTNGCGKRLRTLAAKKLKRVQNSK